MVTLAAAIKMILVPNTISEDETVWSDLELFTNEALQTNSSFWYDNQLRQSLNKLMFPFATTDIIKPY